MVRKPGFGVAETGVVGMFIVKLLDKRVLVSGVERKWDCGGCLDGAVPSE